MNQIQIASSATKLDYSVRDLLEEVAVRTEDLRICIEGIQELVGEIAADPAADLQGNSLMGLQVLDSICQRVAALPELVRSLKTAVPAELCIENVETIRAFSALMHAYQGAAISSRPGDSDGTGDFEIWKI